MSIAHHRAVHRWDMLVHDVQAVSDFVVPARSDGWSTCPLCRYAGASPSLAGLPPHASPPPLRVGRSRSARRTSPSSPSARRSCRQPAAQQQTAAVTNAATEATAAAVLVLAAGRPYQTQVPWIADVNLQTHSLSSTHAQHDCDCPVRPWMTTQCDLPYTLYLQRSCRGGGAAAPGRGAARGVRIARQPRRRRRRCRTATSTAGALLLPPHTEFRGGVHASVTMLPPLQALSS